MIVQHLDAQAFLPSAADEHGIELAALDTMQHRLPGDAQALGRFLHHPIALGDLLHETAPQCVVDADAPWRAGCELLACDEAVIEPTVDGRSGEPEFAGGLAHAHQFTSDGLGGGCVPGNVPVTAQIADQVLREAQAARRGALLLVEDARDGGVVVVLNAIYEEDFLGLSYGFRPGRGQHDALDALSVAICDTPVNWILDADIRGFFDAVSQEWLVRFLEHRIGDERVIRLVRKWLKAGVLEEGNWSVSEAGTPQGAVASPLLANVYLHYVFDLWAHQWRRREATGNVIVVRYADDIVAGFEHEADARRFWDAMRTRFEQFALELHGEKTRLLEFGRHAAVRRQRRGLGKPETFTFLGFTFICGKSRRGAFQLQRKTRRDRMRAKLREIKVELRTRMHHTIPEQGRWLQAVVRGFFAYHAVPTNARALGAFHHYVTDLWRRTLRRRSQKTHVTWQRMTRLAADWLPPPRILHPWPDHRFAVTHPR